MTHVLRLLALILSLAALPQGALWAQNGVAPSAAQNVIDYTAWETTALRAEDAILAGRASNLALEQLRAELADWRTQFLQGQDSNATRIDTLNQQIAALGPLPGEGVEEPAEIALRRSELNAQREELLAPVRRAEEAYSRADGLIGEIDVIIRTRQTDQLLELGPSPLNLVHWPRAGGALLSSFKRIGQESAEALATPSRVAALRKDAPLVLFYLGLAALLLIRGRRWMIGLTLQAARRTSKSGAQVYSSLISLGQIVLPFLGLMALLEALYVADVVGLRGGRITALLPQAGLIVLAGLWLAGRLFPRVGQRVPLFNLAPQRLSEARGETAGLALVAALWLLLARLAGYDTYDPAELAVLSFPLLCVGALLMFRLAQLLLQHVRNDADSDTPHPYRNSLVRLVARAAMALAVLGPVMGAVGYQQASVFLIYPAIYTLALLGLLAVLQRFVYELYGLILGDSDGAQDALVPVLIGFVLFLAAVPVMALIWGTRVADLTELWTRFTEGFQLGETRLSPADFLVFAIIFTAGYFMTRLFQGALRSTILPKTKIDTGGQNAIVSGTGYLGIFLAAVVAITATGIDLSSLAIVAGALSVGIGFGLQNIVSNFVSGIILLIERPVSEGDWIEVGGVMGTVRNISVRSTRVETFDRTDVIVPNSDLISGMVTNWTRSNVTGRIILKVGAAYGSDTRKVHALLEEVAQAHPIVIVNPPPLVTFVGFGADSLDFEVRCVLSDINFGLSVRSELNHEIARRFAEEGIEIPFAQRDIWLRNPEALRGQPETVPELPTQTSQSAPNLPKDFREDPDGDR